MSEAKDPSGVAVKNGQFLGLECGFDESQIVLFQVPWDVTTSYRPGTVWGPEAVINASYQLDLYTPWASRVWEMPLFTAPESVEWKKKSQDLRVHSQRYIDFLEAGGEVQDSVEMQKSLEMINKACHELHEKTYQQALSYLRAGKRVLTLGGDHSISFGPLKACAEHFGEICILHFDAHADLRNAYEGFKDSHASIMFNALNLREVTRLVQVGIRDVSQVEIDLIESSSRVKTYFDWTLGERKASGESWNSILQDIVSNLGQNVYISFDIDGLDPKLCPSTGTPVPGGLELFEATSLIQAVLQSGRKIVGADLVEVAPGPQEGDDWDGNVGARTLFQLAISMWKSLT